MMIEKGEEKFCTCGCGATIPLSNTWMRGHYQRGINGCLIPIKPIPNHRECECGCGELVASNRRFKWGHGGRGTHRTEETKQKMRNTQGDPKNRKIMSERQIKANARPGVREQKSRSGKIAKNKPEEKERTSRTSKEAWLKPGRREKNSKAMIVKWADLEWKVNQIIAVGKGLDIKPNKPETLLRNNFLYWHPKIIYSGDYSVIVNGKNPDFICFEKKKIIEFNGSYWHRNDIPGEREKIFAEVGYDTLILVDKDLLDINQLKTKVDEFMERENLYVKF